MFIAGIWHGAGLQFLIFGLLHGVYLCVNHAWRIFRKAPVGNRSPSLVTHSGSVLLTFACVLVGQVFFRASSTGDAVEVLRALIGCRSQAGAAVTPQSVLLLVALAAVVWLAPNTQEILGQADGSRASTLRWLQPRFTYSWPWAFAMGTLLFGVILFVSNSSTFLYSNSDGCCAQLQAATYSGARHSPEHRHSEQFGIQKSRSWKQNLNVEAQIVRFSRISSSTSQRF